MRRHSIPFRMGRRMIINGQMHIIVHVNFGANRLQLKSVADGSISNEQLHKFFAKLAESEIRIFDEIGIQLDFSDNAADILALSKPKRDRFYLRVAFVRGLDPLGRVGPDEERFIKAVASLCAEHKSQVSPNTAYKWLLLFRNTGNLRSLAMPRAESGSPDSPSRMHQVVADAVGQVLSEENRELEARISAQKGKMAVRGRSGLSLKAITLRARARVEWLHIEQHKKLNEQRLLEQLAPLALPKPPDGPSNRTVQRLVYSDQSRWKMLSAVYGPHVAKRVLGPHGHSFGLTRICQRWEVDMFIVDIIISVYYQGMLVPVGVPYLLVMIDCFSGAIVGMTVEFTTPTAKSFLALLKQCMQPKDWLFNKFPSIKHPFAAFGLPEVIGFDNGAIFSTPDVTATEAAFNIILDPASPYSPNDKPFIESSGSVLRLTLTRYQPGNKASIADSRAFEYNAHKQPPMPIDKFVPRLWEWLWNVYHQLPMEDKQGWTRQQSWNQSLQDMSETDDPSEIFTLDKSKIDLEVAVRHELRYTDEGFTISNRHYRSEEMHLLAMRVAKTYRFDVREDLCNPSQIFVNAVDFGCVVCVRAACEIPEFLTAEGFDHLLFSKRQLAETDIQQLAQALDDSRAPWTPPRGAEHIPTSKDGLAALIKRHRDPLGQEPASPSVPTTGPKVGQKDEMRDAFKEHFQDGARNE